MTREEVLRHPAYWFEYEQNELFRQVSEYMHNENINRTELAKRLGVGKSYVSQILNGNYNYTLKKWIELCLAIGIVPGEYRRLEDVIQQDINFSINESLSEKETEVVGNKIFISLSPDDIGVFRETTTRGEGMAERKQESVRYINSYQQQQLKIA